MFGVCMFFRVYRKNGCDILIMSSQGNFFFGHFETYIFKV